MLKLPCRGVAVFDEPSGIGYRCEDCMAMLGSVGQPRRCKEEAAKWDAYEKNGMWRWNYKTGEPESCQPGHVKSL